MKHEQALKLLEKYARVGAKIYPNLHIRVKGAFIVPGQIYVTVYDLTNAGHGGLCFYSHDLPEDWLQLVVKLVKKHGIEPHPCGMRQHSDQMACARCNVSYDMNDDDPPLCKYSPSMQARIREALHNAENNGHDIRGKTVAGWARDIVDRAGDFDDEDPADLHCYIKNYLLKKGVPL